MESVLNLGGQVRGRSNDELKPTSDNDAAGKQDGRLNNKFGQTELFKEFRTHMRKEREAGRETEGSVSVKESTSDSITSRFHVGIESGSKSQLPLSVINREISEMPRKNAPSGAGDEIVNPMLKMTIADGPGQTSVNSISLGRGTGLQFSGDDVTSFMKATSAPSAGAQSTAFSIADLMKADGAQLAGADFATVMKGAGQRLEAYGFINAAPAADLKIASGEISVLAADGVQVTPASLALAPRLPLPATIEKLAGLSNPEAPRSAGPDFSPGVFIYGLDARANFENLGKMSLNTMQTALVETLNFADGESIADREPMLDIFRSFGDKLKAEITSALTLNRPNPVQAQTLSVNMNIPPLENFMPGLQMPGEFLSFEARSEQITALKETGITTAQALANQSVSTASAASAAAQVIAAIKAEKNGHNIKVRLDPPELGVVKIEFTMDTADGVKAVLTAERSETLDHMRKNAGDLMEQLKQAGFTSVDLEFSQQDARAFGEIDTKDFAEQEGADVVSNREKNILYLSMRSESQLDLLV